MVARIHVADPYTNALCPRFLDLVHTEGLKHVALSGGRTPRAFFEAIATHYRDALPWERLTIWQVDERCVSPDHEDSNWRLIESLILDNVPEAHGQRMEAELSTGAERYEDRMRQELPLNDDGVPVFDLVLLGLGADGHTASLFPDTPALDEARRWVVRNPVPQLGTERLTLTFPVLNAARHRWFTLRGVDRRDLFREVLAGRHPAGRIRDPEWFVESDVDPPAQD